LKNVYIIPKHIFADIPPGNWHLSDYNLKPIGSGPYKFISYDEQSNGLISAYHLQAWNSYAGNNALIQKYNFQFFTNETNLIQSFNNGQIDGFGNLSSNQLSTIKRPYDLFAWRTPGYYAVFFNESKNLALQDANVRLALSQAVDRDSLVQNALGGKGIADYGPVPMGASYFTSTAASTSLELASATLTQAGWQVSSGTFRAKTIQKVSVPLVINLTVPNIDFLVATANILAQDWESVGVNVTIATDSPESIISNTVKNRNYESLLFGNILEPSSDLYSFWDSSQRFSPGLNLAIYQNKSVDKLIEAARQDMNEASRTQEFAQAEQDIVNDNPAIFLYSPNYLYVTNKSVRGISADFLADPSDRLREATGWYLNTTRVLK
jgi:peptide/nickel transport system substrate-binding protein